jgi:hypothetical protein
MREQRWDTDGEWQETDLDSGWTVRERMAMQGGRRVVSELSIVPTSGTVPAGGITARLLRRVKVGQFARCLQETITQYFGADAADRLFDGFGWSSRKRPRRRPQHRRVDDRYYAELARDYVTLWQQGDRKPTNTLARLRDGRPEQIRSHIHLARANGFLSGTKRGTAGGLLTRKAERELAKKETGEKDCSRKVQEGR